MCINLTRRSRCNRSSRCCYRAREHVDPTRSRKIRCGGDSHPETPSSPCSVGLARAHTYTRRAAWCCCRSLILGGWCDHAPHDFRRFSLGPCRANIFIATTVSRRTGMCRRGTYMPTRADLLCALFTDRKQGQENKT